MPLKLSKTASNKNLKTTNFTLYKNRTENCGNETMGVATSRFSKLRHPTDFFHFFEYFASMKLVKKVKLFLKDFFKHKKRIFLQNSELYSLARLQFRFYTLKSVPVTDSYCFWNTH